MARWRFALSFPSEAILPVARPGDITEDVSGLVDHFFRLEAGKMVAYLTKIFGLGRFDLAQDVAHDTLCRALRV